MDPFDAELYLRFLGERELLRRSPQGRIRDSPLVSAASVLVAIAAIEDGQATEIVEAYTLATALRAGDGMARRLRLTPPSAPTAPEPRRTVLCDTILQRSGSELRVRSVTLSPTVTRLGVLIRSTDTSSRQRVRAAPGPMAARFSYPITDDRGGRATTNFSGGGGDSEWRGRLTSTQPLAVDTAWIELDGTRIELSDTPGSATVTIEPVENNDPARDYIWRWLSTSERHGPHVAVDPVIDVLALAAGVTFDESVLAVIHHAAESRRLGGHNQTGPPPGPVDGTPPEWRSLLNPNRNRRSAQGRVAIGATTPPFDGMTVIADELIADGHGWQVEIDVTPGIVHGPFDRSLTDRRIAWWALDDRGQYYLGQLGSFSGGPDGATGTLEFSPALDAGVKTLTLLPTGPTERARIEFPLDWSEQ